MLHHINVYNLKRRNIFPVGIRDTNNNNITNINDMYELIEEILSEPLEILIRMSMDSNTVSRHKYVVVGGKALNNVINMKYLKKSFDYDVHIMDSRNYADVMEFGNNVVSELNNLIDPFNGKFKIYRNYIIALLKRYNLISDAEKDHYLNNRLFYYGDRQGRYLIRGIFIHFKFHDNIFDQYKYTNNRLIKYPIENEIYYPIFDIDLDLEITFGVPYKKSPIYTTLSYDNVRYATYFLLIQNLIRYMEQENMKQLKNLKKLINFVDINRYNCYFISTTTPDKMNIDITNILRNHIELTGNLVKKTTPGEIIEFQSSKQKEKYDILSQEAIYAFYRAHVNNNFIFSGERTMSNVFEDFSAEYIKKYSRVIDRCRNNIIIGHNNPNPNNIFVSGVDVNNILGQFENAIYIYDKNRYIYLYTTKKYKAISKYIQYKHFGLDLQGLGVYGDITIEDYMYFTNGTRGRINKMTIDVTDKTLPKIIEGISDVFKNIRLGKNRFTRNLDSILDEFYVYRVQNYINFNSASGDIFNPYNIKLYSTMYIPFFISTTFNTNYDADVDFIKNNSFILKIKINKQSRKWLLLSKYSANPLESEILIDKDTYLVIEDFNYKTVRMLDGMYRDILVLSVKLCDDIKKWVSYYKNKMQQIRQSIVPDLHNFTEKNISSSREQLGGKEYKPYELDIRYDKLDVVIQNTLIYDISGIELKEHEDTLKNDATIYADLYNRIYSTEFGKKILTSKPIHTTIHTTIKQFPTRIIEDITLKKKIDVKPISFQYEKIKPISPLDIPMQPLVLVGGSHYKRKYIKCKKKYKKLKKNYISLFL